MRHVLSVVSVAVLLESWFVLFIALPAPCLGDGDPGEQPSVLTASTALSSTFTGDPPQIRNDTVGTAEETTFPPSITHEGSNAISWQQDPANGTNTPAQQQPGVMTNLDDLILQARETPNLTVYSGDPLGRDELDMDDIHFDNAIAGPEYEKSSNGSLQQLGTVIFPDTSGGVQGVNGTMSGVAVHVLVKASPTEENPRKDSNTSSVTEEPTEEPRTVKCSFFGASGCPHDDFWRPANRKGMDDPRAIAKLSTGTRHKLKKSYPGQYPFIAAIRLESAFHCAGSVIAIRFVLSAKHCAANADEELYSVTVGEHSLSMDETGAEQRIGVERIHRHPNNGKLDYSYDFAIFELAKNIKPTTRVQSIALPKPHVEFNSGDECFVVGWGSTDPQRVRNHAASDTLREVRMRLIAYSACKETYGRRIDKSMICAGHKTEGMGCHGDSGGPLICKRAHGRGWYQVGVISWGEACVTPGKYGVFARVTAARKWVKQVAKV